MADDVGGGGSTSGDYENAALNVLNDGADEGTQDQEEVEETTSDDDASSATPPDYEEIEPEAELEEPPPDEEVIPEEVPEEDLSLAGKKAYDKIKRNFPKF